MKPQKINAQSEQIKTFKFHKDISKVTSLPFITTSKNKSGRNWFDIPVTGDYAIDCNTGSICASMLIKAMRDDDKDISPGTLQSIVLSLLDRSESHDELTGIIVGFFSNLDYCLRHVAKNAGSDLDNITYDQLIEKVAIGLKRAE